MPQLRLAEGSVSRYQKRAVWLAKSEGIRAVVMERLIFSVVLCDPHGEVRVLSMCFPSLRLQAAFSPPRSFNCFHGSVGRTPRRAG